MKSIKFFVITAILTSSLYAQVILNYENSTQWTFNSDIIVEQNLVYTSLTYGMQIWDVSDHSAPVLSGRVYSEYASGNVSAILKDSNTMYLAHTYGKVQVIDVTDAESPEVFHDFSVPGQPVDLELKEDTLFVLTSDANLYVYDVTEPTDPHLLKLMNRMGTGSCLEIHDDCLYIGFNESTPANSGMYIADISNISTMHVVNTILTNGFVRDIFTSSGDSKLYAAADTAGLKCYDMSLPDTLQFIGGYKTSYDCEAVLVSDNKAYVSTYRDGLQIIDVTDPGQMSLLGKDSFTLNQFGQLGLYNNTIYQLQWGHYEPGVLIKDVSNSQVPVYIGRAPAHDFARYVTLQNNRMFISTGHQGTFIYDVSDTKNIIELNQIVWISNWETAVNGSLVFLCSYDHGLLISDISDVENPVRADSITEYRARGIVVNDTAAYVAAYDDGFYIADIQNIFDVSVLGHFPANETGNVLTLDVKGNNAFLACRDSGVQVLDFSYIDDINKVGSYPTSPNRTIDVKVYGTYLFVAIQNRGVDILDISDVSNPVSINFYSAPAISGIFIRENSLVVSTGKSGVELVSIENINSLSKLASYNTPSNSYMAVMDDDHIFIADYAGVVVLTKEVNNSTDKYNQESIARSIILVQNYPNPFNPVTNIEFELTEAGNVRLEIFNINGQKIKTLAIGRLNPSRYAFIWDATDNQNQKVSSGTYFYRFSARDQIITKKMVLIR